MYERNPDLEWRSWRSSCKHFEDITEKSFNDVECEPLVAAIKRWGEELVVLRQSYPLPSDTLIEMRTEAPIHPGVDEKEEG